MTTIQYHIVILTVRFLESRTGASSSELLGLASTRIGNEKTSVVCHEGLLNLHLRLLVTVCLCRIL